MPRVTFLVDGFNLYHSLLLAGSGSGGGSTKWLDLRALLSSYLSVLGAGSVLHEVYYFSALATHLDSRFPGKTTRHRTYIECLRSQGVIVELGRFKFKEVFCSVCKKATPHYEEKETDVAISARLMELCYRDAADTFVLVTGDTDLAPVIRTATRLYPSKEFCFGFPFRRKNKELAKLVSRHFRIHRDQYAKFQFHDPLVLPSGRSIPKPPSW